MLSVAIMAHPKRQAFVEDLQGHFPEAEVVWDRRNDRWDTGRRSLLAFDPKASHHLVIQDDALPCRDLLPALEQAVKHSGEHPLGLYVGHASMDVLNAVKAAREDGGPPWLAMEGPWWGPGIVFPTEQIRDIVAWGDNQPRIPNYDRRITRFYASRGIECWYTLPSLVDHRPGEVNPSLVPGRTSLNRVAQWFIGDGSPLEIDWSREPAAIDHGNRAIFRHRRSGAEKAVLANSGAYRRMINSPGVWTVVKRPKERADAKAKAPRR